MAEYADMLKRHQDEIKYFQDNCDHPDVRDSAYEPIPLHGRYEVKQCWRCGKVVDWCGLLDPVDFAAHNKAISSG